MTGTHDDVEGYQGPIHRSLWERPLTLGAPRLWAAVWLCGCLYATLMFLVVVGMRWALLPLVIWAIGQGVLVLLTQWDGQFDDLAIAHIVRKYKKEYEAG